MTLDQLIAQLQVYREAHPEHGAVVCCDGDNNRDLAELTISFEDYPDGMEYDTTPASRLCFDWR